MCDCIFKFNYTIRGLQTIDINKIKINGETLDKINSRQIREETSEITFEVDSTWSSDDIFVVVENHAQFPGGMIKFQEYIKTNLTTGRMKLPADLPREQIVIEPDQDVSDCKKIGEEVTEELEYTPGKFFVRQYVRPKYARLQPQEGQSGVVIGTLPARLIDKGIAGSGLLAQIIMDKYADHLPLFRQIERFKRAGITFPISTLTDWVSRSCQELAVLYEAHRKLVLGSGYLEGDETTIKVLDKDKKGKTHLGYYWVYRAPLENLVLFDYREGRGREGPKELLKDFKGYLQTDGYEVYEYFGTVEGITLVGCMAHARRKFKEALDNDQSRAGHVLTIMQGLYELERNAKDAGLSHEQRHAIRQEEAVPVLEKLERWMKENYAAVLPQSPIGKAIAYSLQRWEKLASTPPMAGCRLITTWWRTPFVRWHWAERIIYLPVRTMLRAEPP